MCTSSQGSKGIPPEEIVRCSTCSVYLMALVIPFISMMGVGFGRAPTGQRPDDGSRQGLSAGTQARWMLREPRAPTRPNWWILGGDLACSSSSRSRWIGRYRLQRGDHLSPARSRSSRSWWLRLTRELEPDNPFNLVGTAIVIFRLSRIAVDGAGSELVDDRPAQVRSAVSLHPLA